MVPTKLILTNFQSFRGEHVIPLPRGLTQILGQNLDDAGSVSNYSGKTTLLNALSVCLYGRSPLIARSKGFINWDERWASVEVVFDDDLSIKRYIKHPDHGNKILKGCEEFVEVTQDEIDDIFGSFEAFVATVFFGTNYSDFLEKILKKPVEAKELLTSLIPKLQVFDEALNWVREKMNGIDKSLRELELEESNVRGQIQSLSKIDYEKKKEEFEKKRSDDIAFTEGSIREYESRIASFGKLPDEKKVRDEIAKKEKQSAAVNDSLAGLIKEAGIYERQTSELKAKVNEVSRNMKSIKSGICPMCKQSLPRNSDLTVEGCTEKIKKLDDELLGIRRKHIQCEREMDDFQGERDALFVSVRALQKSLESIREIAEMQNTLKSERERLGKLKAMANPHVEEESRTAETIKGLNSGLEKMAGERKRIQESLPYYEFLQKAFGPRGVKNFVFDEIVFKLTEASKQYLDYMTNGSIQVRFDPRKEKKSGGFTETIGLEVSSNGRVLDDFLLRSQGERKKVCLAVDLAMNQLLSEMFGAPLEFVVFDEAFDGLDRMGVELFCSLLRSQLGRIPQMMVVSHSPYAEDLFDQQITVVKENGESRISSKQLYGPSPLINAVPLIRKLNLRER